jgi:hypothetical protein
MGQHCLYVRMMVPYDVVHNSWGKNVKLALEQAMKAQRRSRGIALLFL